MARKRKFDYWRQRKLDSRGDSCVIEVKLENEQPTIESSDGEEEMSEDEEEEYEEEGQDEDEDKDKDLDQDGEEEEEEDDEEEEEDEDEEEEDDEDEDEEEDEEEEADEDEDEEEKNDQVEDEEEDFSSKESIRKLLEPFGKNQLIEIFKEAALKYPSLLSRVVNEADAETKHRNIFVHGLGWDVTSETLAAVFSPFGKIDNCKAITDYATGRCKGYGFVLFHSRSAAQRALKEPQKKISGRIASCHFAYLRGPAASGEAIFEITGRKLYVSNIGSNINPERLRAFFSKFGEIEQGPLGYDPATGKLRGYALFIYKTVEGLNKALEEPKKYFEGCELQCRKATEGFSKSNNTQIAPGVAIETVPAGMKANDFTLSYPAAALMGHNLTPGSTTVIGPSVGVGLLNPVAGFSPALSGGGAVGPLGSANRGSGISVNSISPSVIGNYGSLAALQGIGAYQNSSTSAAMRPQSGIGSLGASGLAPFYRH